MDTSVDIIAEVRVRDGASRDECLNAAVDQMMAVALQDRRHGVQVTRLGGQVTSPSGSAMRFPSAAPKNAMPGTGLPDCLPALLWCCPVP